MGRKKEYNEEEVLEKAMYCFWKNGYLNTSIRQLEHEMGINQFSIYASFGNKANLYVKVLDNYIVMMKRTYLKELSKKDADINDIQKFLIDFGCAMADKKLPTSCLMISSMIYYEIFSTEIKDAIDRFTKLMVVLFKNALTNSLEKGMIKSTTSVKTEAQYLLGITQSLSIINKTKTKAELKKYITNSISKLD